MMLKRKICLQGIHVFKGKTVGYYVSVNYRSGIKKSADVFKLMRGNNCFTQVYLDPAELEQL